MSPDSSSNMQFKLTKRKKRNNQGTGNPAPAYIEAIIKDQCQIQRNLKTCLSVKF